MSYMATITLRLPDPLDEALTRQSAAAGVSKSDLVREALRRYLLVGEFRSLREQLIERAEARGVYTDDDVFAVLGKD